MIGASVRIVCDRTGKQVYATQQRAEQLRQRIEAQMGRPYRSYRCHLCGFWHLTSQPRHRG